MIKTYVLIMVISGGSQTGKTTVTQEFNSLEQCQYVWTSLKDQLKGSYYSNVTAGGCFLK
jgi:uridine kinase